MTRDVRPTERAEHHGMLSAATGRRKINRCSSLAIDRHREGSDKSRFFAVLHVPPITSPVDAVQAAIIQEYRTGATNE